MSMAYEGKTPGMEVSRGATEDLGDVFTDAAARVSAAEGAYIRCLLERVGSGELGVYALSARCRTTGAICYKVLDGDAELVFGHVVEGDSEAYFLEAVVRSLFDEEGVHTVRSNFNWPEPGGFILGARALGFAVTERMSMCRCPGLVEGNPPEGFELMAWQDRHVGDVCRIMHEAQSPADRPVYPMFSRPEGVRGLMDSVLSGKHGRFLRELSYVARADHVVGFLLSTLLSDGSILVLDVGVDKDFRRRGVGGAMLDRLIGDSYRNGYGLIVLAVTSSNYDAIRLYERKGFRVNGYFRQYVLSKLNSEYGVTVPGAY
ncbi:MAG TPA: GNAT family N-acetyltransferase, partial [Methanocella sp.]|nr:GNAT family N-acetyltransferase [Methanocella sp.]